MRKRIFIAVAFAIVLASALYAQDVRPVARMTDELRTAGNNCEELLARMDSYMVELNNDPSSRGFVILYGEPTSRGAQFIRRRQINNSIAMRRFDLSRITIVSAPVRRDAKTQFWIVPAGADEPELLPADAEYSSAPPRPDPGASRLFAEVYSDGIAGCTGDVYDPDGYAAALTADTALRGRVEIGEVSAEAFKKQKKVVVQALKASRVAVTRVSFVYKKVRRNSLQEYSKFWLVPSKKIR